MRSFAIKANSMCERGKHSRNQEYTAGSCTLHWNLTFGKRQRASQAVSAPSSASTLSVHRPVHGSIRRFLICKPFKSSQLASPCRTGLQLPFNTRSSARPGLAFSKRFCRLGFYRQRGFLHIFIGSMAVGRSISARVPQSYEILAEMQLPRQRTLWPCRSSSTTAGKIASEGRCELKWQQSGNWRNAEQTLSQLKDLDPKWKQFVKRLKSFVKRLGNEKDVKRSANISMPVKAVRLAAPVVSKVPIWQRRNLLQPPSLELDKVRPSRSRNASFSIV